MALSKYLVIGAGALFFGLVAFLVKFGVATGRILSLVRDMLEGKVSSVNGRLTTSKADQVEDGINRLTNQSTQTYSYVVKNEYFEVSQEAYEAMDGHTGANFRLYVTPRSRYLVALEASVAEPGTGRDAFKLEYKDPS